MYFESLNPSDWAAWVQAIAATAAIFFSARFGRKQSQTQYENSRKLQQEELRNKELVLTEAITEMMKNTDARVQYVKDNLSSREAIGDVVDKNKYFDLDCLTEVLGSLGQIPLQDIASSKVLRNVMHITSAVRQLEIQMEKALMEYRRLNADDFKTFLITIEQIKTCTTAIYSETNTYLNNLKEEASNC